MMLLQKSNSVIRNVEPPQIPGDETTGRWLPLRHGISATPLVQVNTHSSSYA